MPGPALHHLIADELRQRIRNSSGLGPEAAYEKLKELLDHPENLPYLFLGCQGPDFLFFNVKDWSDLPAGEAVKIYYEVYDAIDDFKKTLLDLVPQPILDALDALGAAADEVVSSSSTLTELEQLFSDMKGAVEALMAMLVEMLKKFVSDQDVYALLSHPYRDGQAGGEWWWFDVLHYRKTGRYAQALLKNTSPDSPLHLYALGYLTHFTGDTVGHPYVNINSGGPYRSQSQRHKTAENFQDVYNLLNRTGKDWNRSKLHAFYNFNYRGNISGDDVPDPATRLPDDLAKLIADTIREIFEQGAPDDVHYGRNLTPEDVDAAYRLWYRWMRSATDTGTIPEPVPYSLTAELEEVWNQAMDNLGDIGDFLEDAVDSAGGFSILGIFLALAALIVAAVAAALALIDAVLGALTTLTTAGIRYAASLIYEQLYNAYQNFRLAVSLNSLAFPMLEHLGEVRFRQFKNTGFADPFGISSAALKNTLPKLKVVLGASGLDPVFEQEKHLVYPPVASGDEPRPATGGPDSYFNETSLHYAFGDIPLDQEFIDFLTGLEGEEEKLGDYLRLFFRRNKRIPMLGNAVALTGSVYDRWKKSGKIPDFNLDADRGYAYPCWTQVQDGIPDERDSPDELLQQKQQRNNDPVTAVGLAFIPPAS